MVRLKTASAVALAGAGLAILLGAGSSGGPPRTHGWRAQPPSATLASAPAVKAPPNVAAAAAKARLDSSSAKKWYVQWNEQTGMIQGISGESKQYSGSPRGIAEQFLSEYRSVFTGAPIEKDHGDVEFAFDTAKIGPYLDRTTMVVKYTEIYKGVPVYRAGAAIHVRADGRVIRAGGTLYHIDSFDVMPSLSPEGAVAAIKALIAPDTVQSVAYARLSVQPGPPTRLIYDIWADVWTDPSTDPFTFLLDARSGELLGVQMMSEVDSGGSGPPSKPKTLPDSLLKSLGIPPGTNVKMMGPIPVQMIPADSASRHAPGRDSSTSRHKAPPKQGRYESDPDMVRAKTQARLAHTTAAGSSAPHSVAWFFKASYSPSENRDGDDYDGLSYIDWDADTDLDSLRIHIAVYGRDQYNRESFLAISGSYLIYDSDFDNKFVEVPVPYQGIWSFRLAICDEVGNTLDMLDYGEAPVFGPPLATPNFQEPKQEDAVFINTTYDPPDVVLDNDWDGDGFYTSPQFLWKVRVEYDSAYILYARLIGSGGQGSDYFIWYTAPCTLSLFNNVGIRTDVAPFPNRHNIWDVRADIVDPGGLVLSSIQYGQAPNWDTLHLERWNEDPRTTTVFMPNPIHRLNDPTLWDMDDADDAVPRSAYVAAWLSHLYPPSGGVYRLTGSYVTIEERESPAVPPPTSPDEFFPFFRGDSGFEAAMVYYYVDKCQSYLQDLGFHNAYNAQIAADVHGCYGADAAKYVPAYPLGYGWLDFGDGGTDHGEDGESILHEYAHAVTDNVTVGTLRSTVNETKAQKEGFADYFACSWTETFYQSPFPSVYYGEWSARDSPSSPAYLRCVNTSKHYPDSMKNEPHADGEIWSACLWQMKQALGKRVTDSLCLLGFAWIDADNMPDTSFAIGARYILRADTLAYNAAHAATITQIFRDRGILPCDCPNQGDINADYAIDLFDVIAAIGITMSGDPDVTDPLCPTSRTDVNNDGGADVFDVIYLIATAFSGGPMPLDPCAP